MRPLSLIDILSLAFSALVGLVALWGILTLLAFSLVFVLPVLLLFGLIWAGYVWWKLRNLTGDVTIIEGQGHEIVNPTENHGSFTVIKQVEMSFEKKTPTDKNPTEKE